MSFERLKSELSAVGNAGGVRDIVYYCEIEDIDVEAVAPTLTPDSVTSNVANIAARDGLTPSASDTCYVQSQDKYYVYEGSAWVLLEPNVITADHTFVAGKGWQRLQGTEGGQNVAIDPATEKDVTGTGVNGTIRMPGFSPSAARLHAEAPLKNYIFLFPDRNGRLIQIGTVQDPATVMATEGGTGEDAKAYAGYTFQVSNDQGKILFYTGAVTLADNEA